jgi:trans-aconitate methyltransferase
VQQTATPSGSWADGDRYEAYVGRWSRPVARRFLADLAVPAGRRWLDVGCGTGALTAAVLAEAAPAAVLGVDASPGFVRHATAHIGGPRASSGPAMPSRYRSTTPRSARWSPASC